MEKDPEFKIHQVKLHDIKLSGIILKIDSELINHYKFGLPESQLKFDIKINDLLLSKYQSDKFQVAANSSVRIPIYLQLKFSDIANIIKNFSNTKIIKLNLVGGADFSIDIPGLPKNVFVPFNVEKTLPAFYPKISLQNFKIELKELKLNQVAFADPKILINLKLLIENEGGALFNFSSKDLTLQLAEQKILNIKNQTDTFTKSHIIELSSEISLKDSLKNIYNTILTNKNIQYLLKGNLSFSFQDVDFDHYEIPFEKKGDFLLNY
jgi:LEA14-like dessication related protein/cupin superfamily acireductone dioxygenase involved in methionine salvage